MGDLRRLIAFDLDGTLIDSRRDLTDSVNLLISELGGSPQSEEAVGQMVGEGARVLVRRALVAAGLGDVPGAMTRFLQIYDTRLLNHTRAYEGIPDAVRLARTRARVAVLTNKPAAPSDRILEGLGLHDLFDDVIGGDGPFPRKPDPTSLCALMDRAGATASQTLLIGDSLIDHETARRASVRCCMATYGYGYATFPRDRLTGDEWLVTDPYGLTQVISRFADAT
ncbi:MAG: HAD family hydrolase [bacterium]